MNKFLCRNCKTLMEAGENKNFPGFNFDLKLSKWLHECGAGVVCETCGTEYRATFVDSAVKDHVAVHYCKRRHVSISDILMESDPEYKSLKERQGKNRKGNK